MAIALKMARTVLHASEPRHVRVEALATIVMWFAAGAFAFSTVASTFAYEGQLIGVAGGALAALLAIICKAA